MIQNEQEQKNDKRRFLISLFVVVLMVFAIWYVKIIELVLETRFYQYGIYPRTVQGFQGVFFAPFLHSGWNHLIDNSVPLIALSLALLYFYKNIAYRLLLVFYLGTGILVWMFARNSYHIGASGIIYAQAAFLFFSGVIRRNINLLSISLIVTFLYGSMVWGIFPLKERVSWESHLLGAFVGVLCAWYFRHQGPPPQKSPWNDESDDDDEPDDENAYWKVGAQDFSDK